MTDSIITPEFRVSFPNVFKPGKALQEGAEPKYNVTMLFPKGADLSALKAAVTKAITEKWGADKAKWPKGMRSPFRDQGEKEFEGYVEGAIFVNATSSHRPGLVDRNLQPILDSADFYPGCYARADVSAFAYDKAGNKGVAFGLNNIQKLRDGEPLGGRRRAEDVFSAFEGGDPFEGDNAGEDDPFA